MKTPLGLSQTTTILLLSVVMVVLFLLGVALVIIDPIPDPVPRVTLHAEDRGDEILLNHLSGDQLAKQTTIIKINGQPVNEGNLELINGIWPFNAGETVKIFSPAGDMERVIEVYHTGRKGDYFLIDKIVIPAPKKEPEFVDLPIEPLVTLTPTEKPTIIPVYVSELNPNQPPVADFTADKRIGDPPFTVHFTDLSWGYIDNYQWNFGDGTTSMLQNPSHTYFIPGSYTISLLVTNGYGSNRKTLENFITIGSPPNTEFLVEPMEGKAPLQVQCTDLSTGNPKEWAWSFGDGQSATSQNPTHIYQDPGTYTISLTATNSYGSSNLIKQDHINVSAQTLHDIYIVNSWGGSITQNGYIKFRITGNGPNTIKIGGSIRDLQKGDIIQLILENSSEGRISMTSSEILAFNFDDVSLFANDEPVTRGTINDLKISGYDSFSSTLALVIPQNDSIQTLIIDDASRTFVKNPQITFQNIGPDSWGRMNYQKSALSMNYQGGAEEYVIT